MPILWHRFAEDSALPPTMDAQQKKLLEDIFTTNNPQSLWCRALSAIGLPYHHIPDGLLYWYCDTPYINWNAMVGIVSGGSLIPEPKGEQFTYRYRYHPSTLWRMIKMHWNISRYIENHIAPDIPMHDDNTEKLVESLALGFCILALTLRIPSRNTALLHDGLTNNNSAIPAIFQRVITQIKALQNRRNQLSSAWATFFPEKGQLESSLDLPEFFWDTPTPNTSSISASSDKAPTELPNNWHGIAIAGGLITGRAFLVRTRADAEQVKVSGERLVLIFPMARPETTELFSYAVAVLYAQGGVLSHAASIAREQNLPSITGLGKKFIADISQHLEQYPCLILQVDPPQGRVKCVDITIN